MEEWLIELEGRKQDLQLLSTLLNSPNLNVTEEKGGFVLRSSSFNPVPDSNDVHDLSTALVEILNGAAKLYNENFQRIRPKAVVRIGEDGKRSKHVRLTALPGRYHIRFPPKRRDLIESWFTIAQGDEYVTRALSLYGSLEDNWRNLYLVVDVIEENVGGEAALCGKGWVPKKKIKDFKRTANAFRAVGRGARHAKASWQPPNTPMSLQEAKSLIDDLLWRWLESKV